jgi:hypothetical protein
MTKNPMKSRRHGPETELQSTSRIEWTMYILHMSRSFRALVFGVLLSLGAGPQLACFMPDQPATQADMDCCKETVSDCNAGNMSQGCCQITAPAEVGLAAKAIQHVLPRLDVVGMTADATLALLFRTDDRLSRYTDHAPPDTYSQASPILRI